jgi:hypothetical protein
MVGSNSALSLFSLDRFVEGSQIMVNFFTFDAEPLRSLQND